MNQRKQIEIRKGKCTINSFRRNVDGTELILTKNNIQDAIQPLPNKEATLNILCCINTNTGSIKDVISNKSKNIYDILLHQH